ncbi:hypothetical protein Golomagni_03472 [Golovinomyces magnicellulatus]|nr:hypothetical protein Golomagni_03472 [Golovinomyces magnicellulatus]
MTGQSVIGLEKVNAALEKSESRFKEMFKTNLWSRPFNNNRYQERLRQYILDYEGDKDDWDTFNEDDFDETFNNFITVFNDTHSSTDCSISAAYHTNFGVISNENAALAASELTKRACKHVLLASNTIQTTSH